MGLDVEKIVSSVPIVPYSQQIHSLKMPYNPAPHTSHLTPTPEQSRPFLQLDSPKSLNYKS